MSTFREKYLKYKMKYTQLKKQLGGDCNCARRHSSIADCPECRKTMPADVGNGAAASSSAAGNQDMIKISVMSMTGSAVAEGVFNRNMTIMQLKQIIERNHPELPVDRQKIIYRPGPFNIKALANNLTLGQSINNTPQGADYYEFDLLLGNPSFKNMFENGLFDRIAQLNKDRNIDGLSELLSEHEGHLYFGFGIDTSLRRISIVPLLTALKRNNTVTVLDLSECNFDSISAFAVADVVRENNTIETLLLPRNRVPDNAMIALVDALRENNSIEHLIYNGISDDTHIDRMPIALANMLRENTRLTLIDFSGIVFKREATTALAEALRHNTTLTRVALRNIGVSNAELIQLFNALRENNNTHIIEINLMDNMIWETAAINDAVQTALQNLRTAQPQITILV